MFCSLLLTAFCFQPTPIICNPIKYEKAIFTAYTLSESETDGSPNIGAGNHNLKEYQKRGENVCASRTLPLHTTIFIRGYGRCEILDRISKRFKYRIDILFPTKKEAFAFGRKTLEYRVIYQP